MLKYYRASIQAPLNELQKSNESCFGPKSKVKLSSNGKCHSTDISK